MRKDRGHAMTGTAAIFRELFATPAGNRLSSAAPTAQYFSLVQAEERLTGKPLRPLPSPRYYAIAPYSSRKKAKHTMGDGEISHSSVLVTRLIPG